MADYVHDYSNFPSSLITRHNFKDIDDDVAYDIGQINTMRSQGLYNQAARYIKDRPYLSQYIMDSTTINTIIEEIYNTQVKAKDGQIIYFQNDEPDAVTDDDVWLGNEVP